MGTGSGGMVGGRQQRLWVVGGWRGGGEQRCWWWQTLAGDCVGRLWWAAAMAGGRRQWQPVASAVVGKWVGGSC
jgi:hypothetical protein